ncbi:MAG: c-type cytochrome [Cytophagales bacterium]|nr:c-type cytochrome [Cytophagales bacterium]
MKNFSKIIFALAGICTLFYLFSFKNPQGKSLLQAVYGDSTFLKLPMDEKRKPANALTGIAIADSLRATLFASEPMLTNPTNIDIDHKGRVWLCEGYNYRPQHNAGSKINEKGDRIVILEDVNGDGVADNTKTYYQGRDIDAALGILVLGNKLVVSAAPHVFIFTDDNADDVPDKKEILFKVSGNSQHDHSIHAFVYGPDGMLYFNFGNEVGILYDKNGTPLKDKYGTEINGKGKPYRQGMVIRCNVDGSNLEVLGHNFRNNYEVAVDAFGTLWQSDNDDDGNNGVRINYVMEYGNYGYTDEMTGAGWQANRNNIEQEIPRRHWHLNDPGVVPNMLITGAGSPTGILVYEGTTLPRRYINQVIHCDAGPKVVRAYPAAKAGAGYTAKIEPLLTGIDDWFRPSDVCVAPDGSLMVADWYDPGVGGHQRGDIVKGRIYRVTTPTSLTYKITTIDFANPDACAAALSHPNMSTRYMAWQSLVNMGDKNEKVLVKLLKSPNPRIRARVLWFLSKNERISKKYIEKALSDTDEDVKIAAIRMARQSTLDYMPYLQKALANSSIAIKRELAIALRNLPATSQSALLWASLASAYDGNDRWYLEALGIGADTHWDDFFTTWKNQKNIDFTTQASKDIIWRARTPLALPYLTQIIKNENEQEYKKYFRALDFHKQSDAKRTILLELLQTTGTRKEEYTDMCLTLLTAEDLAFNAKFKELIYNKMNALKGSKEYLDLVLKFKFTDQNDELFRLVLTHPDKKIKEQATKTLVSLNGFGIVKNALEKSKPEDKLTIMESMIYIESKEIFDYKINLINNTSENMALRKAAIQTFSWGWDGQDYFLENIKAGNLPKDMEAAAGNLLFNVNRPMVREEAAKYIKMPSMDAGKPAPTISEIAQKTGVVENGAKVYVKHCQTCHILNGKGTDFGPGLAQIGSKFGKEGLYMSILQPDAGVSFGYEGYMIKTQSGERGMGIIISDTETDIDLKMMGGMIKSFKKSEIIEKKKMERSMMPNLYAAMTEQELTDLVEYLTTLKKPN